MSMETIGEKDARLPKYSISILANSLQYNCKKHIYLLPKTNNDRQTEKADNSILQSVLQRGNDFEQQLFKRHRTKIVDHTNSKDIKKVLTEAEPGTYLYQLRFTVPESFYEEVIQNTTSYRLSNFIPDFLYIQQDPNTGVRKITVIDAKSSKQMSKSHQFQVASYAFILSYIIKDIRQLEIDNFGAIWLPSDLDNPELFRIDFVLNKIKHVYTKTLIQITSDSNPEWVLGKKCMGCQYFKRCKSDAKETLRSIPYMDQRMVIDDIEDLSLSMQKMGLQSSTASGTQTYSKDYDNYKDAYMYQKPMFLGYTSVQLAKEVDHNIYIYLQIDLYSQKPFVYGIQLMDMDENKLIEASFATDYNQHLNDELEVYSAFIDKFVHDLERVLDIMDELKSRCVFYVYNSFEKAAIQKLLYDLVASDGNNLVTVSEKRKETIISKAKSCLIALFQTTELLGLPGASALPDLMEEHDASIGRFISIEDLLKQNVALGISGYYSLPDVVKWMTESDFSEDPSELNNNKIYSHWTNTMTHILTPGGSVACSTEQLIFRRFLWLQKIMSTYWSLANDYIKNTGNELFPLICAQFKWPKMQTYKHSLIRKLVFFKQIECLKECDEVRMDRIKDLSKSENPAGLILELQSLQNALDRGPYSKRMTFSVSTLLNGPYLQQKLDRLTIDSFRQYILIPDTKEELVGAIKYSDLSEMSITSQFKKIHIRTVDVEQVDSTEIVLVGYNISCRIRRWRLYKRFIALTTVYAIDGLTSLDESKNFNDIEDLIKNPNEWADKNVLDDIKFNSQGAAIKLREEFSMSPSQKDISANIFKKRLQVIWGPPGSGKTEFLALFINWYIKSFLEEAGNKGKSIMIGITAFTRDAIVNLLKRIEKVQQRHGFEDLFSIIYVAFNASDRLNEKSNIITCNWDKSLTIRNKLKKEQSKRVFVIGSTVWHWEKIKNKWKTFEGCNMMIIDESTQLLVSDAVLAISCLSKPNGKLIVAGDHMQLGPIIKNDYSVTIKDANEPLLYGSIQQCLMRTKENKVIHTRGFLLQKDAVHDFGPNTLQLKDNWRMNNQLNEFFQQIYGIDYTSRYPKLQLHLDWDLVQKKRYNKIDMIKSVLNPVQPISLVKLKWDNVHYYDPVESEAELVQKIVETYLEAKIKNVPPSKIPISQIQDDPSVMIVTPHHKQRVAIERKLRGIDAKIPVDTVEKMQGQECDLIIACFSCLNQARGNDFLRDFRRWNVALSRARCKVVILTTDELINPDPTEGMLGSFTHTLEPTDGWALLCLLQEWAKTKKSLWEWQVE